MRTLCMRSIVKLLYDCITHYSYIYDKRGGGTYVWSDRMMGFTLIIVNERNIQYIMILYYVVMPNLHFLDREKIIHK